MFCYVADKKNCTIDLEPNNEYYPQVRQMLESFENLSDCLESCGNDSVCSGVEFDFSNQICILRTTCDPSDHSGGTKCKAHSNLKVIFNRTSAYTCGEKGCGEEDPSKRVTNTDCIRSGDNSSNEISMNKYHYHLFPCNS